jgi:hypothetical protein
MRFDIVLNNLSGLRLDDREIAMTSDGSPVAPAGARARHRQGHPLRARRAARGVHAEVFNVGSDEQNYQVRDIAERVAAAFPGCTTSFGEPGAPTTAATAWTFQDLLPACAASVTRLDADRGPAAGGGVPPHRPRSPRL